MGHKKQQSEPFFFSLVRENLPHDVENPGDHEWLSDRVIYSILAIISVCIAIGVSLAHVFGKVQ